METGYGFPVGAPAGRAGLGKREQPFLPQRAPTFAKATVGKQSFTEGGDYTDRKLIWNSGTQKRVWAGRDGAGLGKSPGLAPGMVRWAGQLVWLHNLGLSTPVQARWMGRHTDYTKKGKGLPVAWTSSPRRTEEAAQRNGKRRGPGDPRDKSRVSI